MAKDNLKYSINSGLKKAIALVLMTTVCTVSVFSVGNLSKKVSIDVDGEKHSTLTLNTETDKILTQVGISVKESDLVTREDKQREININIKKSFNVYVNHGDDSINLEMAEGTVQDALTKAGVVIGENEGINFSLDEAVEPDMNIVVSPLVKIKVTLMGNQECYFVPQCSVSEALKCLGIDFSSEDVLNVDALSDVYEGLEIVVNKVEYVEETVEEEIPFGTVYRKSGILKKDDSKVVSKGKPGLRKVTYKKLMIDGKEIKKEELSSKTISNPTDEIVIVGNDYKEKKKEESDKIVAGKVLKGSATAYTAPKGAHTATGTVPRQGVTIAVNPKKIPYGTKLKITSSDGKTWTGVAEDTGGALMSGSALVDIFMNERDDCIRFGRKQVEVQLL